MCMECWGGVQGSPWKGEIKQMSIVGWRKVGLGTGGIKWWGGCRGTGRNIWKNWHHFKVELQTFSNGNYMDSMRVTQEKTTSNEGHGDRTRHLL